jgi:hypothetical protein
MIFKKQEETKTTHHIVVVNGYTIHRREKLEYDFKEKEWVRKSMTWNCDHANLDSKYQFITIIKTIRKRISVDEDIGLNKLIQS